MIRIINGTYGFVQGGRILPKTSKSDPFELPPDREQELVDAGVAVYVAAPGAEERPVDPENLKLAELKELAAKQGIDTTGVRSKADVIALIAAAQEVPFTEEPPELDPEEPVV